MQGLSLERGLADMVRAIEKIAKSINNVASAVENKSIRETEVKLLEYIGPKTNMYRDRVVTEIRTLSL